MTDPLSTWLSAPPTITTMTESTFDESQLIKPVPGNLYLCVGGPLHGELKSLQDVKGSGYMWAPCNKLGSSEFHVWVDRYIDTQSYTQTVLTALIEDLTKGDRTYVAIGGPLNGLKVNSYTTNCFDEGTYALLSCNLANVMTCSVFVHKDVPDMDVCDRFGQLLLEGVQVIEEDAQTLCVGGDLHGSIYEGNCRPQGYVYYDCSDLVKPCWLFDDPWPGSPDVGLFNQAVMLANKPKTPDEHKGINWTDRNPDNVSPDAWKQSLPGSVTLYDQPPRTEERPEYPNNRDNFVGPSEEEPMPLTEEQHFTAYEEDRVTVTKIGGPETEQQGPYAKDLDLAVVNLGEKINWKREEHGLRGTLSSVVGAIIVPSGRLEKAFLREQDEQRQEIDKQSKAIAELREKQDEVIQQYQESLERLEAQKQLLGARLFASAIDKAQQLIDAREFVMNRDISSALSDEISRNTEAVLDKEIRKIRDEIQSFGLSVDEIDDYESKFEAEDEDDGYDYW